MVATVQNSEARNQKTALPVCDDGADRRGPFGGIVPVAGGGGGEDGLRLVAPWFSRRTAPL